MQTISYCLWFDKEAEEAARFYTSAFKDAKINHINRYNEATNVVSGKPVGEVMTVDFELAGQKFIALNGGAYFKLNPSISFMVIIESEAEIEQLWQVLSQGGNTLMPLDRYDWSQKYGWVQDQYGLSWQLYLGKYSDVGQKICPSLLFTGKQHGRAEEAVNFYSSIFQNSKVDGILRYQKGEAEPEGTVKHSQFRLDDHVFMAMDSAYDHQFNFNEALSIIVHCDQQEEVDYYWDKFTAGGDAQAQRCGWLKDKFGVSWQIVPKRLAELMQSNEQNKVLKLSEAMMQMKKLDIAALERAYEQG